MASFAPAYQHESNSIWLNQLFTEIVDPSGRVSCREYGRDWDDDMVDADAFDDFSGDFEEQHDSAQGHRRTLSSPTSQLSDTPLHVPQRRSSLWQSRSRTPKSRRGRSLTSYRKSRSQNRYSSSQPSERHPQDGSFQMPISSISAFVSDDAEGSGSHHPEVVTRMQADGTLIHLPSTASTPSNVSTGGKSNEVSRTRHSLPASDRLVPGSPAPPYEEPRLPTKALHRSLSSQGWSGSEKLSPVDLRRQTSRLSAISEFSGFPSHPGVRPLTSREVLGEAAGPDDDDDTEYPTAFALTLIIIGICLSVFIISLDRNIITTAIPEITARFHSYDDIGWYGSAYLLTASAFQPLYGRIYMTFETKSSFLTALGIFEVGSLLAALSPSSTALIVARAIQGLGSAGILTGSFVVGTHSVRMEKRPILFAGVGMLYAVGALAGPLLGGAFTDTIGWRWCFWLNLPIGGVTFTSVFFFFKKRTVSTVKARPSFLERVLKLDMIGNVIFLGAITMLFLALQFSEQRYSWTSARVVGLLVGFGVTTIIFIIWLWYKGDNALLPPRIIRQRTVASSCGAAFFIYGTTLIHAYYLPIWFQAIKGDSAVHSGVNMIPYMCANALFGMIAGVFVSKNGRFAPPAILGCAIGTVGCGLLATFKPSTGTGTWIGFEILVSAGIGLAIQQGFSAVQTALPLEEVPIGTATVVASQSCGGAIFVSVGNTLLQNHLLNKNNSDAIPGVNIRAVIELGATNFRKYVPAKDLPALIHLYNKSLQAAFIAAVPLCGLAFLCSLCMEWKSVRKDQVKDGTTDRETGHATEK